MVGHGEVEVMFSIRMQQKDWNLRTNIDENMKMISHYHQQMPDDSMFRRLSSSTDKMCF